MLISKKYQQYITKINPQQRSEQFFHNLAKYLESARELESAEQVIFQLRLATTDMERAVLVEDVRRLQSSLTKEAPHAEYFSNRLSYMELVEDLRGTEITIVELRVAILELELAILQEELPHARRRKQIAESHTQLEFDSQTRYCKSLSSAKRNFDTANRRTTSIIDSDSDTDTVCTVETTSSATSTLVSTSPKRKELAHRPRARVRSN